MDEEMAKGMGLLPNINSLGEEGACNKHGEIFKGDSERKDVRAFDSEGRTVDLNGIPWHLT